MSLSVSPCDSSRLLEYARTCGVDAIGVAAVHDVPYEVMSRYDGWIASGGHAGMEYLARHAALRRNPALVLDGAMSVVSCAIGYYHAERQGDDVPRIAMYAHGDDYHDVVRGVLEPVARFIETNYGGTTRICVDTAPVQERYWAVAAGIGFRGRNGLVIVPGLGSYCFLAEILTTVRLTPTAAGLCHRRECDSCGRCVEACPGRAINADGTVSASRCLSYMTIEHRGEFADGFTTGMRLYGCDACQEACPHNADLQPCRHPEFYLRPQYNTLTPDVIAGMTPQQYATVFRKSAIKRAKLSGLQRNLAACSRDRVTDNTEI